MSTILTVVFYAGFYLLLTGTSSLCEGITAGAIGVVAAAWERAVRRRTQRRFSWPAGASTLLRRIPRVLAQGTAHATGVLLRVAFGEQVRGIPLHVEFHSGRKENPRDRSRRAAVLLAASLAPDAFVVRLDHGREALLHNIVGRQERSRDPKWLV